MLGFALGLPLAGGMLGEIDASVDDGGALLAPELEHAVRTRTRTARAAERDIIDMAPGRFARARGSTGCLSLRNGVERA